MRGAAVLVDGVVTLSWFSSLHNTGEVPQPCMMTFFSKWLGVLAATVCAVKTPL